MSKKEHKSKGQRIAEPLRRPAEFIDKRTGRTCTGTIFLFCWALLLVTNIDAQQIRPRENLQAAAKEVSWNTGIDAAIHYKPNGKNYFFKGKQYTRLTDTRVDPGYPKALPGGWSGLPASWKSGIDAALYHEPIGKVYFFKGKQYVRLTGTKVDPGYPRTLPGGWRGLPASWKSGIDAALYYEPTGKIYFFKGKQYVRLTGTKVDPGYPRTLPGGWRGLPASWKPGIDAAIFRKGHTYFFKGNQYARFTGTKLDQGYPRDLPGGWKFQEMENFVLTGSTCDICSERQIDEWQFTDQSTQGVFARDPVGHRIFSFAAKNTWFPIDAFKQTCCGELDHFNFFDGSGAEADWNNFILPSNPFDYIFDLPAATLVTDESQLQKCRDGTVPCPEMEITPDENFYNNPWFPKGPGDENAESFLEGEQICTYGPWVADFGHGGRPEIHPSELYWWKIPWQGGYVYHLMLLQDDSNRFDRNSDYNVPGSPPGWRPWSKYPRTGEFNIAFELNPAHPPLTYDVLEVFNRKVITSENPEAKEDADDGTEHAIEYDGKIVLKVRELQPNDEDIGVRFTGICRNADNTRLQGFITITSMIGRGDRGDEGYHVLLVASGQEELPSLELPELPIAIIVSDIDSESLQREKNGISSRLIADIDLAVLGSKDATRTDLTVSKVERIIDENQRNKLPFKLIETDPKSKKTRLRVKNIPAMAGARLELTMQSGALLPTVVPALSMAPAITLTEPQALEPDIAAWQAIVNTIADSVFSHQPPPGQVFKVRQWQIRVEPRYAPIQNGRISPEDGTPVSKTLNEAIRRNDTNRFNELLGSAQPFALEWFFDAINLTTGENVRVTTSPNPSPTELQVAFTQAQFPNDIIKLTFPQEPSEAIYQFTAIAKTMDPYGNWGEIRHHLWSHMVYGNSDSTFIDALLTATASITGVSVDNLLTASRLDNTEDENRIVPQQKLINARMLRLLAMKAAQDSRITIAEFSTLVRGANLFGSQ
jgi:hypothetical protein